MCVFVCVFSSFRVVVVVDVLLCVLWCGFCVVVVVLLWCCCGVVVVLLWCCCGVVVWLLCGCCVVVVVLLWCCCGVVVVLLCCFFVKAILLFFNFWTIVFFLKKKNFCFDLPQVSNCYESDSFIFIFALCILESVSFIFNFALFGRKRFFIF